MTVAVVLDQLVAGSVNDAEVTKLVTAAAGLDAKRGDVVTVSKLAFDTQAAAAAKKELDAAAAEKQRADLFNMAKTGGLIVAHRARALPRGPAQPQGGAHARSTSVELPVYRDEPRGPRGGAARHGGDVGEHRARAAAGAGQRARRVEPAGAATRSASSIEQQPDEVARLLRGWLVDRRP